MSRQQPGRNRLAAVGLVAYALEPNTQVRRQVARRQVAMDSRRPDLIDHPVLRHHLTKLVDGDGRWPRFGHFGQAARSNTSAKYDAPGAAARTIDS